MKLRAIATMILSTTALSATAGGFESCLRPATGRPAREPQGASSH